MFKKSFFVGFCLSLGLNQLVQSANVFDVHKYGAIPDGKHMNTDAIMKAIDAATAAPGGGTVHFGNGTYFTGPIQLKSNVNLELAEGALLKFSDNFEDYHNFSQAVSIKKLAFVPLISADHVSHVSITGKGTLDGAGEKWWHLRRQWKDAHRTNKTMIEFQVHKVADLFDAHGHLIDDIHAPKFFSSFHSDHITLRGVTFINSPTFTILPSLSEYITIDHVTIKNPSNATNTDGIDPDSSRHVTITNCFVSTGDDCLAIKTRMENGKPIPAENITISDCVMHSGHGGFVIGSTTVGGVRNVHVRNNHFEGTDNGIRIKTTRGYGGVVEDIHISNITMKNITRAGVIINAFYTNAPEEPVSERTPVIKNIFIEDVTGDSRDGIQIQGLPEKHFDNIQFNNVHLVAQHSMLIEHADHVVRNNFTYTVKKHH